VAATCFVVEIHPDSLDRQGFTNLPHNVNFVDIKGRSGSKGYEAAYSAEEKLYSPKETEGSATVHRM
jgi:hypothetical protein